jgi:Domain of unknown function (DUF4328)
MSTTFCVITLDGQQHNGVDEAMVREWYQRQYLRDHSNVIVWGSNEWRPLYQVFNVSQWKQSAIAPAAVAAPPLGDSGNGSAAIETHSQTQTQSALLPPGSYVPQAPTMAPGYYQQPVVYRSVWGLGIATIVAVLAMIVARLIHLLTYYSDNVYIVDSRGRSLAPPDVAQTAYLLYALFIIVFIGAGVVYSLWIYRAYKNLKALGHMYTDFTPGSAVGYFFVPFVNLWKPYQAVSEIWTKSDPAESSSGSAIVVFWWVCFLILGSANWIGTTLISARVPDAGFPLVVISMIANVVAGILLVAIIVGVHRRQEERFRLLKESPDQITSAPPLSSAYSILK